MQIFRSAEKAPSPLSRSPNSAVQGVGYSSGTFQPEAVSLVMAFKQ
jgi:hypothetical protein